MIQKLSMILFDIYDHHPFVVDNCWTLGLYARLATQRTLDERPNGVSDREVDLAVLFSRFLEERHWPFRTWGCIWRRLTVWERWMLKCQASFRATWAMRLTQVKYGVWMGHEEDRTCVVCLWWTGNGMHCRASGQVKTLLGRVWSSSRAPHLEIQDHHLDDGTFTGSWAFISAWGKWTSFLIHNVR